MNTVAFNVEDINTSHITECLSLSFAASFFFGSASFAHDHSSCARMIWILTTFLVLLRCKKPLLSFSTMNLSVCCANTTGRPVISSINSSDFHSWEDQVLSTFHSEYSWWVSVYNRAPRSIVLLSLRTQRSLAFVSGLPRAFLMQWKIARRTKIHHWFRLCYDSLFPWILLSSFRHCIRANCRTEMADVKQGQQMIPLLTCEISLGWHVCELVFGVDVLDLDLGGSKLIRSNNQSSATLWVLETCLIVGLLPFMIILITASLSSNTYNKASWWEDWTFEGIKSTLSFSLITLRDCLRLWIVWGGEQISLVLTTGLSVLSRFWVVFPRTATIRSHKSRAGIPV